jgi:RNA polymerase sigma-70 factor (ECF subfamily)
MLQDSELSSFDLARKIANRDNDSQAAFTQIYHRNVDNVYSCVLRILKRPELAEEVTHEVFILFQKNIDSYDPQKSSISTYLLMLAKSAAKNVLKREMRYVEEKISDSNYNNQNDLIDKITREETIRESLAELPKVKSDLLIEHYVEGNSIEELSVKKGMSIGTIKSHLARAREILKTKLALFKKASLGEDL